ncbi:glycoside hydrolase family 6 protein [Nocardioides pacificus]
MAPARAFALALILGLGLAAPSAAGPATSPVPSLSERAEPAQEATRRAPDPRLTRPVYVDTESNAFRAATTDPAYRPIATAPQAFWLTDHHPVNQVAAVAAGYADRAVAARRTPLVALYAVPGRDCGSHSAGGFTPPVYRKWVSQVARGLRGRQAIAVLEPDAVPMIGDCTGQGNRAALLRQTVRKLSKAGVWVYLDAGHSGWHAAPDIAGRLARAGIAKARGFTTNVSNFRTTAVEQAYAARIAVELRKLGHPRKRYLIETARNGAGPGDGTWCNPPHARLGPRPRWLRKGLLDGYVWVKRPGESDGECNGGPSAGTWWPDGARRLLGLAP